MSEEKALEFGREVGGYMVASMSWLTYDGDNMTSNQISAVREGMGISLLGGSDWEADHSMQVIYMDDCNLASLSSLGVRGVLVANCRHSGDTMAATLDGEGGYEDARALVLNNSELEALSAILGYVHRNTTGGLQATIKMLADRLELNTEEWRCRPMS